MSNIVDPGYDFFEREQRQRPLSWLKKDDQKLEFEDLAKSEWSETFEQLIVQKIKDQAKRLRGKAMCLEWQALNFNIGMYGTGHFKELMKNRLIMGALRYGPLLAPGKKDWDRCESIRQRLVTYEADGNLEHLVDISNLALIEFVEGDHPKRHFSAADGGIHTQEKG